MKRSFMIFILASILFQTGETRAQNLYGSLPDVPKAPAVVDHKEKNFFNKSFFASGHTKIFMEDNFQSWIFRVAPNEIQEHTCSFSKHRLTKSMRDAQILKWLGDPEPFTPAEFLSVLKSLIETQLNGGEGMLASSHENIFYVRSGARVVIADLSWDSANRQWNAFAYVLNFVDWLKEDDCVFARR